MNKPMRWFAWVVLSIAVVLPAAAQDLMLTVRDGDYQALERALDSATWSPDDLGEALLAAAGKNKANEAELLLARGANPDYVYLDRTGVVIAVSENNPEVLEVLLESGADPNWKTTFDWRPLHHAITMEESFDTIILLLLEYGASIDETTTLNITPLHRAAGFCRSSAVRILLEHGASKDLRDKYGQTARQRAENAGCTDTLSLL